MERPFLVRGAGPLPHPATQSGYAVGGRVGERADTALQQDTQRTDPRRTRLTTASRMIAPTSDTMKLYTVSP